MGRVTGAKGKPHQPWRRGVVARARTAINEVASGDANHRRQRQHAAQHHRVRPVTRQFRRLTRRHVERQKEVGRALRATCRILLEALRDQRGDRGRHVAPPFSDWTWRVLKVCSDDDVRPPGRETSRTPAAATIDRRMRRSENVPSRLRSRRREPIRRPARLLREAGECRDPQSLPAAAHRPTARGALNLQPPAAPGRDSGPARSGRHRTAVRKGVAPSARHPE